MNKTHYRKVMKSDHLGVADLEDYIEAGSPLIFTIKEVRQQMNVRVAGVKGDHNIAYFQDVVGKSKVKPWVINATNAKILKEMSGSAFIEDWAGLRVMLYIDPSVKMRGEITGGVRVNPNPPPVQLPDFPLNDDKMINNAVQAYKRDGHLNAVEKRYTVTQEAREKIQSVANGA
jgi:hypothetical protein